MSKKFKIVNYIILGISVLAILQFFIADYGYLDKGLALANEMPSDMKVLEVDNLADGWGALIFKYTIGLLALCALGAIGFSLYQFVKTAIDNPKKAIRSGLVVVGIGVIILISYLLASDVVPHIVGLDFEVTNNMVKWVDTGLWIMYIVFGLTILSVIIGEISKIWK